MVTIIKFKTLNKTKVTKYTFLNKNGINIKCKNTHTLILNLNLCPNKKGCNLFRPKVRLLDQYLKSIIQLSL